MNTLFENPNPRRKHDFYPTPEETTLALLHNKAIRLFPKKIWEPACGNKAISKVLSQAKYAVVSTDITRGKDFLKTKKALAPAIITNPPFSLAAEFIEHTRYLKIDYLALLLKVDFFCAAKRFILFEEYAPSEILLLTWRPDFTGGGAPAMPCAWYVWRPTERDTRLSVLRRDSGRYPSYNI
jgi:hypothetical protein